MKYIWSLISTILLLAVMAGTAVAQDEESTEESLLPEIDPQDIEIRSQFQARFPGLNRQPILGFDPTPRVYQIDSDRMPFMETPEQVVADLPVSDLTRPDPPPYTPLHYSSEINAFGRFGMGSYISPEAQFWGVKRINSKSYVGGDLDYSSSNGHLEDQESSFRFFDASGEYATKLSSRSRLSLQGGVENSFNNMPDYDAGISDEARKEYGGFNLGAEFVHHKNDITGWNVQANMRYFNTELNNAGSLLSGESDEFVYHGSVARRWAGSNVNETFTIKVGAKTGNYDNKSPVTDQWLTAQGGVKYKRLFNYSTQITADASVYYGMDAFNDQIYLGPSITIEHPLMEILTLTVKGGAEPYLKTVEQLHTGNRFLSVENPLKHSYKIYGSAEAKLEFDDVGSVKMGVRYENTSDHPIFLRADNGRSSVTGEPFYDFYETNYVDAYKVGAYVGMTHQVIPEKFWLDGKLYLQSPNMQNDDRLPYEEKIGLNSGLHIRPIDKLSFEVWGDYIGPRRTFQTNEKLEGYLLLGGQVDVQITDRFGAYIKLVNLLDQQYERWQGYTERPFQAYGGITVKL